MEEGGRREDVREKYIPRVVEFRGLEEVTSIVIDCPRSSWREGGGEKAIKGRRWEGVMGLGEPGGEAKGGATRRWGRLRRGGVKEGG